MSSYLWAASGHCILLHTKESLCTTQSPRKWGGQSEELWLYREGNVCIRCCAAITSVQNFTAEDVTVYYLMKQIPNLDNEGNNFSATFYVYSYTIHQVTVTRYITKSYLWILMSSFKIMVVICMLNDRKTNKTTVDHLTFPLNPERFFVCFCKITDILYESWMMCLYLVLLVMPLPKKCVGSILCDVDPSQHE